jgi:hypothetical protein
MSSTFVFFVAHIRRTATNITIRYRSGKYLSGAYK